MGEHEEQSVFEMGYNKGFKDGIKGSIPKDQYEARLKADLEAILVELQLVIEGKRKDTVVDGYDSGYNTGIFVSAKTIQDKINTLKGENT